MTEEGWQERAIWVRCRFSLQVSKQSTLFWAVYLTRKIYLLKQNIFDFSVSDENLKMKLDGKVHQFSSLNKHLSSMPLSRIEIYHPLTDSFSPTPWKFPKFSGLLYHPPQTGALTIHSLRSLSILLAERVASKQPPAPADIDRVHPGSLK